MVLETVGLVKSGYGRLEYSFPAASSWIYNLPSDLIMPEIVYPQEDGEPLGLGHGRVVYASYRPNDFRWQYPLFQVHCGIVALPAVVQAYKTKDGDDPYWVMCERYPADYADLNLRFSEIPADNPPAVMPEQTLKDGFMAPPGSLLDPNKRDERTKDLPNQGVLARWHFDYRHFYELGTLYTMVAGILNLLAVYDAFCGPAILTADQRERLESKKKRKGL